jgi:hypothetical protein
MTATRSCNPAAHSYLVDVPDDLIEIGGRGKILHDQRRLVRLSVMLDLLALHLPANSAGQRSILEDSPAAANGRKGINS